MPPHPQDWFNLLIVHGDPAVRNFLGTAARRTGRFHSIRAMASGRFALEWMLERLSRHDPTSPELILVDLDLPELNGEQFTREFRRADPLRQTWIAFFAASARPADRDAAETAGADLFFRRPATVEESASLLAFAVTSLETKRDYDRLDAYLSSMPLGCAMLTDNVAGGE